MPYADELTGGECSHDDFWYGEAVQVNRPRYDLGACNPLKACEEIEGVWCRICGALVVAIISEGGK